MIAGLTALQYTGVLYLEKRLIDEQVKNCLETGCCIREIVGLEEDGACKDETPNIRTFVSVINGETGAKR